MRTPFLFGVALATACTGDASISVQNVAPSVTITSPVTNSIFEEGETITFTGIIQDDRPVEFLTHRWASSVDGELASLDIPDAEGNLELVTANLSPGVHVIELQAVDADGTDGSDNITITIDEIPELPSIQVLVPTGGSADAPQGRPFIMLVNVNDAQDPVDQLVVTASDDANGLLCYMVPDGNGDATCTYTWPDLGNYLLTFEVTDTDGNSARANVALRVLDPLDFDADGDGYSPNGGDCNDSNDTMFPGAPELCDGLDNDCIASSPIDVGTECYDDDGDGFCEEPPCVNTSSGLSDCNDADASIVPNPSAVEQVNGTDDDCDGRIDEDTSVYDDDGDGFCESGNCINASGTQPDCNDGNASVSPAQNEDCGTAYDDDCDGLTNNENAIGCTNYYYDNDGDTYGIPGGTECWCSGGSAPYTGTNTNDCYDNNASARPNQTQYFASHRGDGSYDYNCVSGEEKRYRGTFSGCSYTLEPFTCESDGNGWQGGEPSCGNAGTWVGRCEGEYNVAAIAGCLLLNSLGECLAACNSCWYCDPDASGRTQECR
jgi:hypothetical protein